MLEPADELGDSEDFDAAGIVMSDIVYLSLFRIVTTRRNRSGFGVGAKAFGELTEIERPFQGSDHADKDQARSESSQNHPSGVPSHPYHNDPHDKRVLLTRQLNTLLDYLASQLHAARRHTPVRPQSRLPASLDGALTPLGLS